MRAEFLNMNKLLLITVTAVALALGATGCSIKRFAVNKVGNALADSGTTFASDDDPELVKAAAPFSLKLMESLLAETPRHEGLLLGTSSGFTQFAFAFVQQDADFIEEQDFDRAKEMRVRAKKLYLRALEYGLRSIETEFPGFRDQLRKDPDAALAKMTKKHVPRLYWTGASWAAAFAINKADADLAADQTLIEKMMQRALALDEAWNMGAVHDFFISWEAGGNFVAGTRPVNGVRPGLARTHYHAGKRPLGKGPRTPVRTDLDDRAGGPRAAAPSPTASPMPTTPRSSGSGILRAHTIL